MHYELVENQLTVEDFQMLRNTVGWGLLHPLVAERSVQNSHYSVCSVVDGKVIGMARLIGDNGGYANYIQDVVVLPEYQGQGIGQAMMEKVLAYVEAAMPAGSFVMVSLMAVKDKEGFYERLGFVARPNDHQGPGMVRYFRK